MVPKVVYITMPVLDTVHTEPLTGGACCTNSSYEQGNLPMDQQQQQLAAHVTSKGVEVA